MRRIITEQRLDVRFRVLKSTNKTPFKDKTYEHGMMSNYLYYIATTENPFDYDTYRDIVDEYGTLFREDVKLGRKTVLVSGLGCLQVKKAKRSTQSYLRFVKNASRAFTETIDFDGYYAKTMWLNRPRSYRHSNYRFSPSRKVRALIHQHILDGNINCYQSKN